MNQQRPPTPYSATDAIAMLLADHQKVRQLFREFDQIRTQRDEADLKAELVEQLCGQITVHSKLEEEIFYPAVRAAIDDDELMDEAEAAHAGVSDLIRQIETLEPDDEQIDATVSVLREQIEQHISDEENNLFPKARQAGLDLDTLRGEMDELRQELEGEGGSQPAPRAAPGEQGGSEKPSGS
ncbi:hemerythrin domain-containing protein [Rugamonas sp. CCM 8940]|uniref:hemerythrin domain-containing protein n=1 Tax=Rugamonas sp. CCM 8940 TaxID=2765359 RepID=UPI0018F6F7AF|nr:hemerythrin domain-containing protein [Rugamonas sp. CCM 8940]MBJ7313154.1 hemerythrin domain-containing protein [Rugamonas sp. CCM 8940]